MKKRVGLTRAIWILLILVASGKGYAGGTGGESLGSEELPVLWGFVSPRSVDFAGTIEQYLAPLELETSLYIDAVLFESHSVLVSELAAGSINIATLPVFTYLVAADRGLIVPGLLAAHRPTQRQLVVITRNEIDPLAAGQSPIKFARFDPLSSDGWLSFRIVLSGNGVTEIEESAIFEVGSYREAIEAVSAGDADVVTMPRLIWENEDRPVNLKIYAYIEAVDSDGIHFAPEIDIEVKTRITDALLERSAAGRLGFLADAYGWDSLRRTDPTEFDRFRLIFESVGIEIEDLP